MNDRSSAQPLLQVDDLRVSLPTAQGWAQALRGVSWRMERGQTVGLIGIDDAEPDGNVAYVISTRVSSNDLTYDGMRSGQGIGVPNLFVENIDDDKPDEVLGTTGNDVLTGGAGNDIFAFGPNFGNDRIIDFDANPAGGQDLLNIAALGVTAANFVANVTIADVILFGVVLNVASGLGAIGFGFGPAEGSALAAWLKRVRARPSCANREVPGRPPGKTRACQSDVNTG